MKRSAQFPADLARHVEQRLAQEYGYAPPQPVLVRFLETLYFASLKTDEGRPPVCTVNVFDPQRPGLRTAAQRPADCWSEVRFAAPVPLDVRSFIKLARAADPSVSSLAVTYDHHGELFLCGLVDQELHYSDFIALDAAVAPPRPGLFQATITGVGNVSVYVDYRLIGSLEQNTLVQEYHDVLWCGPVHELLKAQLRRYLAEQGFPPESDDSEEGEKSLGVRERDRVSVGERETLCDSPALPAPRSPAFSAAGYSPHRAGLLVRWLNALCRILMSIQRSKHGGGVIVSPTGALHGLNVKYRIRYERLPAALLGIDQSEFHRRSVMAQVAEICQCGDQDERVGERESVSVGERETLRDSPALRLSGSPALPASRSPLSSLCALHYWQREFRKRFDECKSEVLGCTHFIAALACVDGFVLMDRRLHVHGFGVEVCSGAPVEELALAGDPHASPERLRPGNLEQFGTRHRAMIRYCWENPGALGFVVSQDGDIRAMLRLGERLVLWENIEVQLAFRSETGALIRHDRPA